MLMDSYEQIKARVVRRFSKIVENYKELVKIYVSYTVLYRPEFSTAVSDVLEQTGFFKVFIDNISKRESKLEEDFQTVRKGGERRGGKCGTCPVGRFEVPTGQN